MDGLIKTVTFGVIAYNESRYLPDVLGDLLKQTYPQELIEVILVDGGSLDNTWQIMADFRDSYQDRFLGIKIFKNDKRTQPAGWNVVLLNLTADILLRIDAHARLTENFIENSVNCINSGEDVCGGPRENIVDENTLWKKMLLDVEQSMLGAGFAVYRHDTEEKKYVNSLFHGAYRTEVIKKVGLFNEKLIRTEDNEYHYRIRRAGYKLCYDPGIKSYYQTRSSLKGMLKQKYLNGFWIGKTLHKCPKCISLFHLMPLVFIVSLIVSIAMIFWGVPYFFVVESSIYIVFLGAATFIALSKSKNYMDILLPLVIFLVHCLYGIGTLAGVLQIDE